MMHRPLLFLLVLLPLVVRSASAPDPQRFAAIVEAAANDQKFMGAVLVSKAGDTLFEQTHGFANLEWKTSFAPHTKFRIGSVTKQFTAAALLLLEEQGKLQLDDRVASHFPDAPDSWKDITLHHLLTHTSGIPSVTSLPDYAKWKLTPSTPAETLAHVRDLPLEFTPGEKFNYSNSGYILLGAVIEHASGVSYEAFITAHLFKPLGMADTGYDSLAAIIPLRASGYIQTPDGLANAPYIDMHFPHGAGGLYSTTRDLVRWTNGVFGGQLLSAASLKKMLTPLHSDYALGVGVKTNRGRKVIAHGGGIEGFNAHLAYYPESRLTVAVLSNVNGPAATELAARLADAAFDETVVLPSERTTATVSDEILKSYVGIYQLTPQHTITMRFAGGQLTTQLTGQPAFPIFPESETKFFLKVVDAQLEFAKDTDGRVTHVTLHQNGRSQKAPRIHDPATQPGR